MKNKLLLFLLVFCSVAWAAVEFGDKQFLGKILVGSGSQEASAVFQINSTEAGSIPFPKMSEAQRDAISSPASGLCIYNTDTLTANCFDGSTWGELAGAGGNARNLFPDFEADDTANIATYDDGSAAIPVDGDGGTVDHLTISSNTSTPINKSASYRISKAAANAQGEGVKFNIDAPGEVETDSGRTVTWTFEYKTSANYDNDSSGEQLKAFVYRVGSNTLEACSGRQISSNSSSNELGVATVPVQFQCTMSFSSTDTDARFLLHTSGTGTSAYTIDIDLIDISVVKTFQAPILSGFQDCPDSFTTSWDAWTTVSCKYKRLSDEAYFDVKWAVTDAGSLTGNLAITNLGGLTIDTSKMQLNVNDFVYIDSHTHVRDNGVNSYFGTSQYLGPTDIRPTTLVNVGSTKEANTNITPTDPHTFANTDTVVMKFRVPIVEWSGANAALSTTQADQKTVKVEATSALNTVAVPATGTDLVYATVNEDDTGSYNSTTGVFTAPVTSDYFISASIDYDTASSTSRYDMEIYKNGNRVKRNFKTHTGSSSAVETLEINSKVFLQKGDTVNIKFGESVNGGVFTQNLAKLTIHSLPDFSTFGVYGQYDYDLIELTADTQSNTGSYVDVTGAAMTIQPGTFELCYQAMMEMSDTNAGIAQVDCALQFEDSANTKIPDSETFTQLNVENSVARLMFNNCVEHTVTEETTIELNLKGGTGSGEECTVEAANTSADAWISYRRTK